MIKIYDIIYVFFINFKRYSNINKKSYYKKYKTRSVIGKE